jgi:glycosyltransferase involved in cell wall biosynthesis
MGNKMTNDENGLVVCTIISKNYLSFARTFTDSFLRYNPDGKVFVMLADKIDEYFDPRNERFELVCLDDLKIDNVNTFCFKYNILELNTAVKPFLLQYMFEKYNLDKLCYFDPDILITENLGELSKLLDKHSIILTPHLLEPIDDDCKPGEFEILKAGTYNLGFIALSNTDNTRAFINWWQKKLYRSCWVDPDRGFFVDQRWIDLVPGIFDNVYILREPGYNVAYWNIHGRHINRKDEKFYVNDKPMYFFHFSGFEPENMQGVSKYQDRFRLNDLKNVKPVFETYQKLLVSNHYLEIKNWPYAFDYFDNGIKIPKDIARKLYKELGDGILRFGNPFSTHQAGSFFNWMNDSIEPVISQSAIKRVWYEIYNIRPDVQDVYPDIFGKDRKGFIGWIQSVAEREYKLDTIFLNDVVSRFYIDKKLILMSKTNFYLRIIVPVRNHLKNIIKKLFGKNKKIIAKLNVIDRQIERFVRPDMKYVPLKRETAHQKKYGINIAGYFTGECGVAESARATVRAVQSSDIPYVLNNIEPYGHRLLDATFQNFSEINPYSINLMNINVDETSRFCEEKGIKYFANKYNIGRWSWELSHFPEEWIPCFRFYNEIWTISKFCAESIAKVSPIPVISIPFAIDLDNTKIDARKSRFGLDDNSFVFLFIFDFVSIFERKNPLAIIKAFVKAFDNKEDVVLVLKCINDDLHLAELEILQKYSSDHHITILDGHLSKDDINSLIASCDCYISLHRAEAFGLTMAEAMYLGKPVIATGYSGNMDFMNVSNSFLVKHRLIELEKNYGPYSKGNVWADPDITHAAELMRFVYDNQEYARKTGIHASEDIKRFLNPVVVGNTIKQRIERLPLLY